MSVRVFLIEKITFTLNVNGMYATNKGISYIHPLFVSVHQHGKYTLAFLEV